MAICTNEEFTLKEIQHEILCQQVREISSLTMDFPHWESNPKPFDKA